MPTLLHSLSLSLSLTHTHTHTLLPLDPDSAEISILLNIWQVENYACRLNYHFV